MLRASEAGLLAGLFPSLTFGARSVNYKVPYITTLVGAYNTVKGIAAAKKGHGEVKSLQEYHASIEEI